MGRYASICKFWFYSGFVPRGQHYFGNRYAIICKGAISDFERDHQLYKKNANELKLTEAVQSGKIDKSKVPNLPVSWAKVISVVSVTIAQCVWGVFFFFFFFFFLFVCLFVLCFLGGGGSWSGDGAG